MIIEPFDEIQVFVTGTGCCLWGRIQPDCRRVKAHGASYGGVLLQVTTEPLFDTVTQTRQAGVMYRDGMDAPIVGKFVFIPNRLVDVIFGDNERQSIAV